MSRNSVRFVDGLKNIRRYNRGYGKTQWEIYLFYIWVSVRHKSIIYRVSQEERTKLREGVPYVKLYRYNTKHLYPKLNFTEIMAIEKCGLLGCPRTVSLPWRHIHPLRMPGKEKPLANIGMQWRWRDNAQLLPASINWKSKDKCESSASVL